MDKIPEKAPDWQSILKKDFKKIFNFHQSAEIQLLIEKNRSLILPLG